MQVVFDTRRCQMANEHASERRRDDILSQSAFLALVARLWAPLVQPPRDQLAYGQRAVGRQRIQP